jgi:aryl-alcohol dehydrogenase-like predicted oxidoreductase
MKSLAVSERYGYPRFVAHQVYYSLVGRDYELELMPLALDQKVGAVVWSPLGWGRLTGKMRRGQPLPQTSRLRSKVANDSGSSCARTPTPSAGISPRSRLPARRGQRHDAAVSLLAPAPGHGAQSGACVTRA